MIIKATKQERIEIKISDKDIDNLYAKYEKVLNFAKINRKFKNELIEFIYVFGWNAFYRDFRIKITRKNILNKFLKDIKDARGLFFETYKCEDYLKSLNTKDIQEMTIMTENFFVDMEKLAEKYKIDKECLASEVCKRSYNDKKETI